MLQPVGSYNFLVYSLQLNGATTPPILQHPLDGAQTNKLQLSLTLVVPFFIHFHTRTMNAFSAFLTKNLSLSPLKNHWQQFLITMKTTTSPYQHLVAPKYLSQNKIGTFCLIMPSFINFILLSLALNLCMESLFLPFSYFFCLLDYVCCYGLHL